MKSIMAKVTRKQTGKSISYKIVDINIQGDMFVLIFEVGFAKFEIDKFSVEISTEPELK